MSCRLFLSYASDDADAARGLSHWLTEQGWSDHFLDIDPRRGLLPAMEWKKKLLHHIVGSDVLICLLSPSWLSSVWCCNEAMLAEEHGVPVLGAWLTEPRFDVPEAAVLSARWQTAKLSPEDSAPCWRAPVAAAAGETRFSSRGLDQLRMGLERLDLARMDFNWSVDRSPYPGLRALTEDDAAVYFGREAALSAAMRRLRQLTSQTAANARMPLFVVVGASGAGKSSFMRAGMLARLKREGPAYWPLPTIRPGHDVVQAFADAHAQGLRDAGVAHAKAEVAARWAMDAPRGAQDLLADAARLATAAPGRDSPRRLVLAIDQLEEAFEGGNGARTSWLMRQLVRLSELPDGTPPDALPARAWLLATLRADRLDRLQQAASEHGLSLELFNLGPMPQHAVRSIIEGPVNRARAQGLRLEIDPELTEALSQEARGRNSVPLLAHALRRLHDGYGDTGRLSLDQFKHMGGLQGALSSTIKQAFAEPQRHPLIPSEPQEQLRLLRRAFLPWLASVDAESGTPQRRIARWRELPAESQPLLKRLVDVHLLQTDAGEPGSDSATVEVAHEALLDIWDDLKMWLAEDRESLASIAEVQRSATRWAQSGRRADDLQHRGSRLASALALRLRPDLEAALGPDARDYLDHCASDALQRARLTHERAVNLVTALAGGELANSPQRALCALNAVLQSDPVPDLARQVVAQAARVVVPASVSQLPAAPLVGAGEQSDSRKVRQTLESLFRDDATGQVLASRMMAGQLLLSLVGGRVARAGPDASVLAQAIAHPRWVTCLDWNGPAGHVVTGGDDGMVRLWRAHDFQLLREVGTNGEVTSVWLSQDGHKIVAGNCDGELLWFDLDGQVRRHAVKGFVKRLAATADGSRVAALCTGPEPHRLWVLDAHDGRRVGRVTLTNGPQCVCVSEDGAGFVLSEGRGLAWSDVAGRQQRRWARQGGLEAVQSCARSGWVLARMGSDELHGLHASGSELRLTDPLLVGAKGLVVREGVAVAWGSGGLLCCELVRLGASAVRREAWRAWRVGVTDGRVAQVAVADGGTHLAVLTQQQRLLVAPLPLPSLAVSVWQGDARAVRLATRDRHVAIGLQDGTVALGSQRLPAARVAAAKASSQFDEVRALEFSPDGRALAAAHRSGLVSVWHWSDGAGEELTARSVAGAGSFPKRALWTPDGNWLVLLDWTGQLRWLDARSLKLVHRLSLKARILHEAVCPDALLAVLLEDGRLARVDLKSAKLELQNLGVGQLREASYRPAADSFFAADEARRVLQIGASDAAVEIWTQLQTLLEMDISPDGSRALVRDGGRGLLALLRRAQTTDSWRIGPEQPNAWTGRFCGSNERVLILDDAHQRLTVHAFAPDAPALMTYALALHSPISIDPIVGVDGYVLLVDEAGHEVFRVPVTDAALRARLSALTRQIPSAADRETLGLDLLNETRADLAEAARALSSSRKADSPTGV